MKLYALTLSPYAARVRLALRLKGLPYEQEAPLGGSTHSAEYLALNPIGKLPLLITDDGRPIAESETIIDWLEDRFPTPSLIPRDEATLLQMRNAIRTLELYAVPALSRLFGQMNPASRKDQVVEAEMAQLRQGLSLVQHFVGEGGFVAGDRASKGDCMVLPTLLLCGIAGQMFGVADIVAEFPGLTAYVARARTHPAMGAVWDETATALRERMG